MQLARTGAALSTCAYTGCWDGPILTRRSRSGVDLLYADVTSADGKEKVMYDRRSRTAQMNFMGFANAMDCGGGA